MNYGSEAKKTQLEMGLFSKDTAGHVEETDPTKENLGLKSRNAYTNRSKTTELIGRLHTDLCNQGRLIINGLSIKLVFHRSKDSFSILSAINQPKVKLVDAVFCIRKVQLTH